jgi:diaminopimelate epimerase
MIDNRSAGYTFSSEQIQKICDRRFGVGADGLMLIEKDPKQNFNLIYYNSDGSQSLCGNGSRAAVKMAASLGMVNGKISFNAYDGLHTAEILPSSGVVKLRMNDVRQCNKVGDDLFINTGSPHFVKFIADVSDFPVYDEGKQIRYSDQFKPGGTNVNFVELKGDNSIFVRTYERGVEDETLSCGTGIVASALAASFKGYSSPINIKALGGDLSVEFKPGPNGTFTDIFLIGPAKMVFEGDLEL